MADSYYLAALTRKTTDNEPEIQKLNGRGKSTPIKMSYFIEQSYDHKVAIFI